MSNSSGIDTINLAIRFGVGFIYTQDGEISVVIFSLILLIRSIAANESPPNSKKLSSGSMSSTPNVADIQLIMDEVTSSRLFESNEPRFIFSFTGKSAKDSTGSTQYFSLRNG